MNVEVDATLQNGLIQASNVVDGNTASFLCSKVAIHKLHRAIRSVSVEILATWPGHWSNVEQDSYNGSIRTSWCAV